ncbi:hypothetical protein EDE12_11259 [Methylosinus sp. sav-2]|nr:hypothetical protein EDE12_11259 [Methylosinus sp. sav-2]
MTNRSIVLTIVLAFDAAVVTYLASLIAGALR